MADELHQRVEIAMTGINDNVTLKLSGKEMTIIVVPESMAVSQL